MLRSRSRALAVAIAMFLRRIVAHWRAIILLLILPCVVFLEARFDEFARFDLILLALLLIFIVSQIFWLGRLVDVLERFIPGRPRRVWLAIMTVVVYLFVFLYSYPEWGFWSCDPSGRLPAAERAYPRRILVVVRRLYGGVSLSDCFRGGRPDGPGRWVGLPQSAHDYTPAHRRP